MKKIFLVAAVCSMLSVAAGCGNNTDYNALIKENEELKAKLQTYSDNSSNVSNHKDYSPDNYSYTLGAGDYDIPADVDEGKYDIAVVRGYGVFNVHDPNNGFVISETMTDNPANHGIQERKNAKLEAGQTVNITGTLVIGFIKK